MIEKKVTKNFILTGLLWFSCSNVFAAGQCPIIMDEIAGFNNPGGVSLNRTLKLLNTFSEVEGAAYDPVQGQIVFVTKGETISIDQEIPMDDLVVAIKSVFSVDENGYTTDPSVSFDDLTGLGLQTGRHAVVFGGGTRNTQFGQILYEADFILKKLGQGVDEHGVLLTENQTLIDENKNGTVADDTKKMKDRLAELGYKSSAQRIFEADTSNTSVRLAYWFTPKEIELSACNPGEGANACTGTKKSFVFTKTSMQVKTRYENENGFPIPVKIINDSGTLISNPALASDYVTQTQAFADNITNNYDEYAELPGFEALKKLKRLGQIVSIMRWIRENDIPIDLSFIDSYEPADEIETPVFVDILQLCSNGNQGVDAVNSGPYVAGTCANGITIAGGVRYDLPNTTIPLQEASLDLIEAALDPDAKTFFDEQNPMAWSVDFSNVNYQVFAQTLAPSGKDGAAKFNTVEFSVPNGMGQQLALTRHYDSFSGVKSGFGVGWSEIPFELIMPESNGLACPKEKLPCDQSDRDTHVTYPALKMVDRVAGKTLNFYLAGTKDWEVEGTTYSKPYFVSARTNDLIRQHPGDIENPGTEYLVYTQMNKNNVAIKEVWFPFSISAMNQKFSSKPRWVKVPRGGLSGTETEYVYDADDRLIQILDETKEHRINVNYQSVSSKLIDNISYASADGTRSVKYSYYGNGKLEMVDVSGLQYRYLYAYPDDVFSPEIAAIEFVNDSSRQITAMNTDFESRQTANSVNHAPGLDTTTIYNRTVGTTTVTSNTLEIVSDKDDKGRLTSVVRTAMVGHVEETIETQAVYDDSNPLAGPTTVTDPRGNTLTYTYDGQGNVASITDALGRTSLIYRGSHTEGPTVLVKDPKGRYAARTYDMKGRLKIRYRRVSAVQINEVLDSETHLTTYHFEFSYLGGDAYRFNYDDSVGGSGALASIVDEGDLLQSDYPWLKKATVSITARNEFGQPTAIQSAEDYMTTYGYDGFAKLTSKSGPADVTPVLVKYEEDGLTQDSLASVSTALGTRHQSVDVIERRRTIIDEKGIAKTFFYSELNQLERVVELADDGDVLTTQYFYNDRALLDLKILPNGHSVSFSYDNFGRLTSMTEKDDQDVDMTNQAPALNQGIPSDVNVKRGDSLNLATGGVDADVGDVLKYYLVGDIPKGMNIDNNTGGITWTPMAGQLGRYDIAVQIVDQNGGVNAQFIRVTADDSVAQNIDNCIAVPNQDQRDTDGDGFGNACDPDLNNDNLINFADLALFKSLFGSNDSNADFNGDSIVDYADLSLIKEMFGQAPGPRGGAL